MKHKFRHGVSRVGFLFNHDELHQIAHTAPIIPKLQQITGNTSVEVITSSPMQAKAVRNHLGSVAELTPFHQIDAGRIARVLQKSVGDVVPIERVSSLAKNLDLLKQFDALVVPETTTTILKSYYQLQKPKLIHIPHGAGDKSIAISPDIRHFDFVLLPGVKTRNRMLAAGVIREDNYAIVGYPKFDCYKQPSSPKFFNDRKPVVLYNPHFDPKLSSWFKFGEKLLDFFASQHDYNLIFAPHVMLFRRKVLASVEHRTIRYRRALPQRFLRAPNILIDTGSARSVDMTYTRAADIYIGDVSSQVYEFIERPRPAFFLNSHQARWSESPSYEFWRFGPVAENFYQFVQQFAEYTSSGSFNKHIQTMAFAETFMLDKQQTSSLRAAKSIAQFLGLSTNCPTMAMAP